MAERNDTGSKAFTAGAAIAKHLRVKISSGKLAAAGITDNDIGTLDAASFADLDVRTVSLRSKPGTLICIAADAIVAGAAVYTAAAGKVSDTAASTALLYGIAMAAASGDGAEVEVMPLSAYTAVT